jgi:UDP-3-O-[3-hydroxymyristoyl] glucosamine N-acyltransferase
MKLRLLAEIVGGELEGNGDIEIEGVAPIETARGGQVTFVANKKYYKYLETTAASAVILAYDVEFKRIPVIRHKNPYYALAVMLDSLYPEPGFLPRRIDHSAVVSDSAVIEENCHVGALCYIGRDSLIAQDSVILPRVYIGDRVRIGRGCKLHPGVNILDDTRIGDNVIIHSGAVIGSDGFGYAHHDHRYRKIKQIGWVEIDSDVEIGANCTVDRGTLGPTKIGRGVKIDNLVQIAHNVEIGPDSIIVAQAGISGSSKLGRRVILAGQVGLVGHINLGDDVRVGAQSGVTHDLPPGEEYFGSPAREKMRAARIEASLARLPELHRRLNELEKKLKSQ